MQIPMEILSQILIPQAVSTAGARQRVPGQDRNDSVFSRIFDQAQREIPYEEFSNISSRDDKPTLEEKADVTEYCDLDDDTDVEDNPLIGVLGYQNNVIFILERDKESATAPETSADALLVDNLGDIVDYMPIDIQEYQPAIVETETEQAILPATDSRTEEAASTIGESLREASVAAQPETANDGAAGEVTARMPDIRTSEKPEKEDNDTETLETGDLGPLENENGLAGPIETKERTESQTDDSHKESTDKGTQDTEMSMDFNPMPITDSIKPERFQGDQQMREASNQPVARENLFDEMVSRIDAMHTDNQSAMTIELKPEFLGKVALEIAMDATGLHVKISAADGDVRNMINGQINALISSLENKGIQVVEVEVAYTGIDNGANQESRNFNQSQSDSRPRRTYSTGRIEDSASYAAMLSEDTLDYYLEEGVSSVEYSA